MIKTISIPELHEKFKSLAKNELILDVRTGEEYAEGHVPGAKNISYETVLSHLDELKNYTTVYVYCHSGGRVQTACFQLMNAGLKNLVAVIDGGMPDWQDSGFPVE